MSRFSARSISLCGCLLFAACGGGSTVIPDGGGPADGASDLGLRDLGGDASHGPDSSTGVCTADRDCDDGVYCNGAEGCSPTDSHADARGCVAMAAGPCLAGQTCDETARTCTSTSCAGSAGDADGDGHRAISCGGDDCDDADANRYPGHAEVCDAANHDEDCDPRTYGLRDLDGDGDPDAQCCNMDTTTLHCGTDCDDAHATVNPEAPEVCNLRDDNCDGNIDEGVQLSFYPDADHDLYGDASSSAVMGCTPPPGDVLDHSDCDDADAGRNPGLTEICDPAGKDEDCNATTVPVCSCTGGTRPCPEPGACSSGMDTCVSGTWSACSIGPVPETCNGIDDNCNGSTDEGVTINCYADNDDDGFAAPGATTSSPCADSDPLRTSRGGCPPGLTNRAPSDLANSDCNDGQASINPGASETCNATDDNCNGATDEGVTTTYYADCDGDGRGTTATTGTPSCVGSRSVAACVLPLHYSATRDDCDDTRVDVYGGMPPATEVCDGRDNNCNGMIDEGVSPLTYYMDMDGDGYVTLVSTMSCTPPGGGYILPVAAHDPVAHPDQIDCNDLDIDTHPGAAQGCTGDTDCNPATAPVVPTWYVDCDSDNYAAMGAASMNSCTAPTAATGCAAGGGRWESANAPSPASMADCNDSVGSVHPGATELCDGYDTDCFVGNPAGRGLDYAGEDDDLDGYGDRALCGSGAPAATDCNDSSAAIHPGVSELPGDLVDQNCDGLELCYTNADGDGDRSSTTISTADLTCSASGHLPGSALVDCCDSDNRANHADTVYYTTARTTCGGFDFNCDTASTQKETSASTISCSWDTAKLVCALPVGSPGWVGTVAGCGVTATNWAYSCHHVGTGTSCVVSTMSHTQACR